MVNCRSISLNFYRGQKNRKKYTIVLSLILNNNQRSNQNSKFFEKQNQFSCTQNNYKLNFAQFVQFPLDYLKLAANVSQITRNNIDFTRGIGGKFAHTPREIIRVVKKE